MDEKDTKFLLDVIKDQDELLSKINNRLTFIVIIIIIGIVLSVLRGCTGL